jgi:DNA polymerase III sliding clamp (beta) subunit (PCNA family)
MPRWKKPLICAGPFRRSGRNLLPRAGSAILKKDKLEVACGKSKAALNGVPASEFPPFPQALTEQGFALPAQALKALLQQVVFAASTDASRVQLTGVLLVIEENTLILAAADGFRLSEASWFWHLPPEPALYSCSTSESLACGRG